jgi:hypothetical protein
MVQRQEVAPSTVSVVFTPTHIPIAAYEDASDMPIAAAGEGLLVERVTFIPAVPSGLTAPPSS